MSGALVPQPKGWATGALFYNEREKGMAHILIGGDWPCAKGPLHIGHPFVPLPLFILPSNINSSIG